MVHSFAKLRDEAQSLSAKEKPHKVGTALCVVRATMAAQHHRKFQLE